MMKDELTREQMQTILQALDEALQKGPWDKSNFLSIAGKKLNQIRTDFSNYTKEAQEKIKVESDSKKRYLETQKQKVFISIYSSGGNNLQVWERALANLPRQLISRGVYSKEEDIQNLIRSKEKTVNEAYAIAYIYPKDILELGEEKMLRDKLGSPLISLKAGAIQPEDIKQLIHLTGHYDYNKGRLIRSSN